MENQDDTHEVRYEDRRPRGGSSRREESIIVCTCGKRCSATGKAGTTQSVVRDEYNRHVDEFGQEPPFDVQPGEGLDSADASVVVGGIDLGSVDGPPVPPFVGPPDFPELDDASDND